MKKVTLITIAVILLVVVLIPGCMYVTLRNRMVDLDEGAITAWAQVETVLQRRYDLIPNLVNTVKGYAKHEKELLENVTRLRSQWGAAKTVDQKIQASSQLEGFLGRLMVVMERYPDLKANQNFLALQDELTGTENRIAVERRRYNEAVRAYNSTIRRFPGNVVASMSGFERREPFEAAAAAAEAPKVEF